MANLLTHLARGDTALSISMTGISSLAAVVDRAAVPRRWRSTTSAPSGFDEDVEMLGVVAARPADHRGPARDRDVAARAAARADRRGPAAASRRSRSCSSLGDRGRRDRRRERARLENLDAVAAAAITLNLAAMAISFTIARLARLDDRQSTAIAIELGVHNTALAIAVAATIDTELTIPAAVYASFMFVSAGLFARLMYRRNGAEAAAQRAPSYSLSSARANCSASNGRRSSSDSPIPISFTGIPSSEAIASATPPLADAVELGQHGAGDLDRLAELLRLADAVLAGGRVDHDQGLVRRPGELLGITRRTFASSSIRLPLVCRRPAVSQMTTSAPRAFAARDRVEGDRAGVAALGPLDDLAAGALGPLGELLDRGGAVGVGRGDDHVEAQLLLQVPGDLADRRRLAGAVDADDHQHRRALAAGRSAPRPSGEAVSASSSISRSRSASPPPTLAGLDLVLEPAHDRGRGRRPDVGEDQRLLELLPGLLVDPVAEARRRARRRAPGGCARAPRAGG